jgi:hypothetical protein
LATAGLAVQANALQPAPGSCLQRLSLSFFFDGTGNNLDADEGTRKHSNVGRLYNAHAPDNVLTGVYRVYIPGVGTYFKEVGDDGGDKLGLAMGSKGDIRLAWALMRFDELLAPHLARATSPSNRITEVNVAVFGFSRGAALARAFVNRLVSQKATPAERGWRLRAGGWTLRIRFMGLFDTVASVGLGLSSNTTDPVAAIAGGAKAALPLLLQLPAYASTLPAELAFAPQAQPGADPAPGYADGHQAWGGEQRIPTAVEQVRHLVAAHEVRNSFPLDSIWVVENGHIATVNHFHEAVYPGAHSDVGGGYRPGEGGKSIDFREKLSQIPLNHMYEAALAAGVPLLPKTAWTQRIQTDFDFSTELNDLFNYFLTKLPKTGELGPSINAQMRLYYAWRFASIRRKAGGDRTEADRISEAHREYSADAKALDAQIAPLQKADNEAALAQRLAQARRQAYIQSQYGNPKLDLGSYDAEIDVANARRAVTRNQLLAAQGKRRAVPDLSRLNEMIAWYDRQLLADVQSIRAVYAERGWFGSDPATERRAELRPHYQALMDAYEDEYIHNRGLKDEKIFAFFEGYVHDSLSGFALDATLPSDPRVVYLGGDEKYRYARREAVPETEERQYASVHHDALVENT